MTRRRLARNAAICSSTIAKSMSGFASAASMVASASRKPTAALTKREISALFSVVEDLRERGYDGGYDAVRRYARRWSKERGQSTAAAYVPLSFAPVIGTRIG